MARRRRGSGPRNELLGKGVTAALLGLVFLATPLFLGNSPLLRAVAEGLKIPAWLALGLGVALIALDRVVKVLKAHKVPAAPQETTSAVHDVLRHQRETGVPPPVSKRRTAMSSEAIPSPSAPAGLGKWRREVFDTIEWRRFEAVCEHLFAQAGFRTSSQSHGADGGVDIWLHSKHAEGPVAVVQCKHWSGRSVGVKELREFFGVMAAQSVRRGTYATSATFTPAATEFAQANGIHLLDGEGLLALIGKRSAEQQEQLLAVAYEGEYWRPTCASCGVKLVERVAAKDQSRFWGCANFPRCRTRLPMKA